MLCKNCNQELDNDYVFCPHCGKQLQQNETSNLRPVVDGIKKIAKTVYNDPATRNIIDDIKTMVTDSITDTKNRTMRDLSKKTKRTTTRILKKVGLKEKNIFDHITDTVKKK